MKQLIPAQRFGEASEVAAVAAFLESPVASYVNGKSLTVAGSNTEHFKIKV